MRAFTRADFFISSKIPPGFMEYKKAQTIIKSSVKAVDLGYLDCMMVLWPGNLKAAENDEVNITNRHSVWKALEEAIQEGQIMGAGVSNFNKSHLEKLLEFSDVKPILNQIETHPLNYDEETINFCNEHDIRVQAYAPFAQGSEKLLKNVTLNEVAKRNDLDVY